MRNYANDICRENRNTRFVFWGGGGVGGKFTVTLPRRTGEKDIWRLKGFGNMYDLFAKKKKVVEKAQKLPPCLTEAEYQVVRVIAIP